MKLLRFGPLGMEKPGILDADDNIRDLTGIINDVSGPELGDETLARLREVDHTQLPIVPANTRIGACVGQVGKFICIGLNYADHAAESGLALPEEPVVFFKRLRRFAAQTMTLKFHAPRSKLTGKSSWVW